MSKRSTKATGQYRALTPGDLTGFDKEARALVLEAVDRGAVGRVSNRGHAILRAPNGSGTASVPPHLVDVNRGGHNAKAAVRRLFPAAPNGSSQNGSEAVIVGHVCPECGRSYETARALLGHTVGAHRRGAPAACPDCGREFTSVNGMSTHRATIHGISKRRPIQAAERAAVRAAARGTRGNNPEGPVKASDSEHYVCPICGQAAPRPRNVRLHATQAHGQTVDPIRADGPIPMDRASRAYRQRVTAHQSATAPRTTQTIPEPQPAPQRPPEAPTAPPMVTPEDPADARIPEAPVDSPERLADAARAMADPPTAQGALSAWLRELLAEHATMKLELAAIRSERDDLRARLDLVREAVQL